MYNEKLLKLYIECGDGGKMLLTNNNIKKEAG